MALPYQYEELKSRLELQKRITKHYEMRAKHIPTFMSKTLSKAVTEGRVAPIEAIKIHSGLTKHLESSLTKSKRREAILETKIARVEEMIRMEEEAKPKQKTTDFFTGVAEFIGGAIALPGVTKAVVSNIGEGTVETVGSVGQGISDFFGSIGEGAKSFFGDIGNILKLVIIIVIIAIVISIVKKK
ncbi:MAG: hypothetical protein ACQXXF_07550 [Thermoplasmatota archaeon]|jgi:hypothetical protein